ncbi:MAG: hypothetical protein Kow0026_27510 [Oricola sp.]
MKFDWKRAVERNLDELIGIVTRLFVMAGIRTGRSVVLLPRGLRLRILSILRPAEFAARRLIVMAACGLVRDVKLRPVPDGPGEPRPTPEGGPASSEAGGVPRRPAFALFDPFKRFAPPFLEDGETEFWWDGDDDENLPPELDPGELVDARAVCRRIEALEAALQDIGGQALRLARWKARRDGGAAGIRPRRWRPMRPGLPPGWRKRPRTHAEEVLKECHGLALHAWDTS